MKTWEYEIRCPPEESVDLEGEVNELNELGRQGWELVAAFHLQAAGGVIQYIFKRELP